MKSAKPFAVLTAAALAASLLCGCSLSDLGTDGLLKTPKTLGNEAEIEQLIADSSDNVYTLKYPKSGSNRSAISMADLDGDGEDEAIAFCSEGESTTQIHMLVMYTSDDVWALSSDNIIDASSVDRVDFSDINGDGSLEIISGYSTYTSGVNILHCHSYAEGSTDEISAGQSYSSLACADFNSDGKDEIITLMLYTSDNTAQASMLECNSSGSALGVESTAGMDPNVTAYSSVDTGGYGGTPVIIVNGKLAGGQLNTQLIYFGAEEKQLQNPLYLDMKSNPTQRSLDISPTDINGDGDPELPSVSKMPRPSDVSEDRTADKIDWYEFSLSDKTTTLSETMIYNSAQNFCFTVPDGWQADSFTALCSEDGLALEFYEWNKTTLGGKLFEIRAFEATAWDAGKYDDEYTLISKNSTKAYALKNEKSDSPLAMADDDIKTAFSVLGGETA